VSRPGSGCVSAFLQKEIFLPHECCIPQIHYPPTGLQERRQLTSDSVICGGYFLNSSTNDCSDIIPHPPPPLQLRPPRRLARLPSRVPRGNRRARLQSPLCAYFGRGRFLGRGYPVRMERGRNGYANDQQSIGQFKRTYLRFDFRFVRG